MTRDEWKELVEYGFERYGGEPHDSLNPVLLLLEELNDDLHHMRSRECLSEIVEKVKKALDRLVEEAE